jgi:hypothetical protein
MLLINVPEEQAAWDRVYVIVFGVRALKHFSYHIGNLKFWKLILLH